jgi:hypothetical protein
LIGRGLHETWLFASPFGGLLTPDLKGLGVSDYVYCLPNGHYHRNASTHIFQEVLTYSGSFGRGLIAMRINLKQSDVDAWHVLPTVSGHAYYSAIHHAKWRSLKEHR